MTAFLGRCVPTRGDPVPDDARWFQPVGQAASPDSTGQRFEPAVANGCWFMRQLFTFQVSGIDRLYARHAAT